MNLDLVLPHQTNLNQKLRNVLALIPLKLYYFAKLFVLNDIAVAAELFLKVFEDFLVAELLLQPLHCGQALLPIPLLDADMDILLCPGGIRFFGLGERVEGGWDLDFQINHVLGLLWT